MAKKASLDILDIETAEPLSSPAPKDEGIEDGSAPDPQLVSKKKRSLKWRLVAGSVVVAALGVSVFWFVSRKPDAESPPEGIRAEFHLEAMANLPRFYVDLRDDQGRIRILACDVGLVISDREEPARLEARDDLRIAIYRSIQEVSYSRLVDPMGFQYLKASIFSALNRMLGPGIVNEVYLSNFLLM